MQAMHTCSNVHVLICMYILFEDWKTFHLKQELIFSMADGTHTMHVRNVSFTASLKPLNSTIDWFQKSTDFVQEARKRNGRVLVHCYMGINRSTTVACAVLMNLEEWTLKEAYNHARSRRNCVRPFTGNKNFIAAWELEKRGHCSLPEWLEETLETQGLTLY